jgi:acyl carrier protein
MDEAAVKSQLREWIVNRAKTPPGPGFDDQTPILDEGILSSLDVVEFVLFIESLRGDDIDLDDIEPEAFTSVETLYDTFFVSA